MVPTAGMVSFWCVWNSRDLVQVYEKANNSRYIIYIHTCVPGFLYVFDRSTFQSRMSFVSDASLCVCVHLQRRYMTTTWCLCHAEQKDSGELAKMEVW